MSGNNAVPVDISSRDSFKGACCSQAKGMIVPWGASRDRWAILLGDDWSEILFCPWCGTRLP